MKNLISEYIKFMRIHGSAGVALIPVFGAISVYNFSFNNLLVLFFIGLLSSISGFVLNDIVDLKLDKLCKDLSMRALVNGKISKKNAIIIFLISFTAAYLLIFIFFYSNTLWFFSGLSFLIVAEVLGIIYNIYGKKIIGSDFLLALAEALFFLFGALVVLPNGQITNITWVFFVLVFTHVLYMNAVEGGLKDADHDFLHNVKNIALSSGVKVDGEKISISDSFKAFGLGIRFVSIFFVFVPFVFYQLHYELWQIGCLILSCVALLILSFKMLSLKAFNRAILRKLIVFQLCFRYSFIPLILVSIIGPWYAFFLLFLPYIWYFSFSIVVGQKLLKPQI